MLATVDSFFSRSYWSTPCSTGVFFLPIETCSSTENPAVSEASSAVERPVMMMMANERKVVSCSPEAPTI